MTDGSCQLLCQEFKLCEVDDLIHLSPPQVFDLTGKIAVNLYHVSSCHCPEELSRHVLLCDIVLNLTHEQHIVLQLAVMAMPAITQLHKKEIRGLAAISCI